MKIWKGFASEHSSNLVMIGRFRTAEGARSAERLLKELSELATEEASREREQTPSSALRFSGAMSDFLERHRIYSLVPREQDELAYDFSVKLKGADLVVRTEEIDVMALLKVLIDRDARIEIYSAHAYGDDDLAGTDA